MTKLNDYLTVKKRLKTFLEADLQNAPTKDKSFIRNQLVELKQEIIMAEGCISYYNSKK